MRKIIKDITQISDRWEKADNGQISILPIYEALETAGLRPQPGDLATVYGYTHTASLNGSTSASGVLNSEEQNRCVCFQYNNLLIMIAFNVYITGFDKVTNQITYALRREEYNPSKEGTTSATQTYKKDIIHISYVVVNENNKILSYSATNQFLWYPNTSETNSNKNDMVSWGKATNKFIIYTDGITIIFTGTCGNLTTTGPFKEIFAITQGTSNGRRTSIISHGSTIATSGLNSNRFLDQVDNVAYSLEDSEPVLTPSSIRNYTGETHTILRNAALECEVSGDYPIELVHLGNDTSIEFFTGYVTINGQRYIGIGGQLWRVQS